MRRHKNIIIYSRIHDAVDDNEVNGRCDDDDDDRPQKSS
jgi:hypothetical protein